VKNKREKDKIKTKPDKKREAWRSLEKSRAVSVNKKLTKKQGLSMKSPVKPGTNLVKPPKTKQYSSLSRFNWDTVHPQTVFPAIPLNTTIPLFQPTPPLSHYFPSSLPPSLAQTHNQCAINSTDGWQSVTKVPQPTDPIEHVANEAIYKEFDDRLVRGATNASSLEAEQDSDDDQMFDVNDSQGEDVFVQEDVADKKVNDVVEVNVATITTTDSVATTMTVDEVTLAQALIEIKKEPVKLKKKDQIMLDEEVALKLQAELQAEFDKEKRLTSEKAQQELEANITLIETWDDVQAKIDVDYQLAERLQAEEQQELTDEEKATLFMQLLEKIKSSL
nr:hypothetical protein [Tanacetum cinerariifolium]